MTPPDLSAAYAVCLDLAHSHYENFPVASRLLPRDLRPHVAAVYAFARVADDFADEPGRDAAERKRLLAAWRARLWRREPETTLPLESRPAEIFTALRATIDRFSLPLSLFDDLLSAFVQDIDTDRYDTWTALLDYCRRSANPVGRLVLRLHRIDDETRDRESDAICTALQLTNFWQDFAVDWSRGRLYLPREIWQRHGATLASLGGSTTPPSWRSALAESAAATRTLFAAGRPLCDHVDGRLRYELRATWLGGSRILDVLATGGFDPFAARPSLGLGDKAVVGWRTLMWRATRLSPTPS